MSKNQTSLSKDKILVGCEESGAVVDRLIAAGLNAWSCDLLPTRGNNPARHIQGDIFDILDDGWNALIGFYDCTFMANSGAKHLYKGMKKENGICPIRWANMESAANDFKRMLNADIDKICMENPIMHGHAKKIIGRGQDQIIHPHQHGHGEQKPTCLWLKNLPKIVPTNEVLGREQKIWKMAPGPNRKRDRSVTYAGIADAMVDQWFNREISNHA